MAEGKLIRTEIDDIIEQIDSKNNFLLSGGAGSGKTYTLVQTIRLIIGKYPTERVACITSLMQQSKKLRKELTMTTLMFQLFTIFYGIVLKIINTN
ncbi:AAA family ATPase [Flavobacterium phycosphaerae]|uniref:AAA family ATPase n=1 Tax=Flavobacterium phycosphaerae TaxID=2697515 RepID=UPI003742D8CD